MSHQDPRPLTRSELAQFLPNQRAIRAFEELFNLIPSDLTNLLALSEEASIDANTGISLAQTALGALDRIADSLELLATKPNQESAIQEALKEQLLSSPPIQVVNYVEHLKNVDSVGAAAGYLLVYDATQQRWEATTITPGSNINVTNADGSITIALVAAPTIDGDLTDNTTNLIDSSSTLSDGAAAAAGTLTNAPSAGDPTKWVAIDDNGTTRHIPAW